MENKIKKELEKYGLIESDLTPHELEELKKEIEAREKGYMVFDGVLFHINTYERVFKRKIRDGKNFRRTSDV